MKKLVVIAIATLLAACDQQDDVNPNNGPEIFRLIVDNGYNTDDSGDWLIVHDAAGKLLYSSRFEAGDTLMVKATLEPDVEKVSITLFASMAWPTRTFEISSYTDIPVGGQWLLAEPAWSYVFPQQQGTFTITGYDIPPHNTIVASTRFGENASFEANPRVSYSYTGEFTRYSGSPHLVWLRDANDNLRYTFFDDVKADEDIAFSYEDLKIPESIIEVDVAGYDDVYLTVSGMESKTTGEWWGYNVGSAYSWNDQMTTIKIGYVDRLKYYKTNLRVNDNSDFLQLEYEKVGDPIETINFPDNVEATFEDKQLGDFSVALSVPFERRVSLWSYYPRGSSFPVTKWVVNSPTGEQHLGTLPKELIELFPTLQVEKLTHSSTEFFLSGSGYDELIETTFYGKTGADEYEFYRAVFW